MQMLFGLTPTNPTCARFSGKVVRSSAHKGLAASKWWMLYVLTTSHGPLKRNVWTWRWARGLCLSIAWHLRTSAWREMWLLFEKDCGTSSRPSFTRHLPLFIVILFPGIVASQWQAIGFSLPLSLFTHICHHITHDRYNVAQSTSPDRTGFKSRETLSLLLWWLEICQGPHHWGIQPWISHILVGHSKHYILLGNGICRSPTETFDL